MSSGSACGGAPICSTGSRPGRRPVRFAPSSLSAPPAPPAPPAPIALSAPSAPSSLPAPSACPPRPPRPACLLRLLCLLRPPACSVRPVRRSEPLRASRTGGRLRPAGARQAGFEKKLKSCKFFCLYSVGRTSARVTICNNATVFPCAIVSSVRKTDRRVPNLCTAVLLVSLKKCLYLRRRIPFPASLRAEWVEKMKVFLIKIFCV